ncbi:Vitamin B12 import ATP-binding protein BtuD [Streptomyces violaceorubidus]
MLGYYVPVLSGGQRQRVVIAMAIANEPALLIADEPTTALDVTVQAEILDLLRRLAAETGTGVLLVTHNMGVVADFADRVAVMYQGAIVETGPVEDVLLRPSHDYTKRLLSAVPRLSVAEVSESGESGQRRAQEPDAAPAGEPAVELRDVSVVFGRGKRAVHALKGVSFAVHPGETLGLVGVGLRQVHRIPGGARPDHPHGRLRHPSAPTWPPPARGPGGRCGPASVSCSRIRSPRSTPG